MTCGLKVAQTIPNNYAFAVKTTELQTPKVSTVKCWPRAKEDTDTSSAGKTRPHAREGDHTVQLTDCTLLALSVKGILGLGGIRAGLGLTLVRARLSQLHIGLDKGR